MYEGAETGIALLFESRRIEGLPFTVSLDTPDMLLIGLGLYLFDSHVV